MPVTVKVIGTPVRLTDDCLGRHRVQRVVSEFDPIRKLTVINCNMDLVTLGITVEVLKKEYEEALEGLTDELAERVKSTIAKVVANEEH